MLVCDFRSSYFFLEIDSEKQPTVTVTRKQPISHNRPRITLESRAEVTEPGGKTTQYVLTASCKTERVAVDRDLFHQPNGDFCVVCSAEDFMIVKRLQQVGMPIDRESPEMAAHAERQVGDTAEAWVSHTLDVDMVDARVLETSEQIVEAVYAKVPIVGRTECDLEDGHRFLVEYPVKTINVSDRYHNYQVDTGPILFPDLSIGHERFIGNFRLAFIAHHRSDWAELIVNVPTPIDGGATVHHYSKTLRIDGRHTMLALD